LPRNWKAVPRKKIDYKGTPFEEMDIDAILARRPGVVLVDELAHTNIPEAATASAMKTSGTSRRKMTWFPSAQHPAHRKHRSHVRAITRCHSFAKRSRLGSAQRKRTVMVIDSRALVNRCAARRLQ